MSRSLKKGLWCDPKLLKKIKNLRKEDRTILKTWSRSSTIFPEMVGYTLGVHNGKEHIPVLLTEEMVGHRLGEFSPTRRFEVHGGRIAKEEAAAAQATETQKLAATKEGEGEVEKKEVKE